jgi:aspartyl protease family protein
MATGFMPNIIALLLSLACGAACAAEVALVGVIGNKAAVLAVDGGDPKTVKIGQTWNGVTVLAVDKDRVTIEFEGRKRVLQQGQHYRSAEPSDARPQTVLAAGPQGHFFGDATVNGVPIRFLVDTGASAVALPAAEADRLGIDYRKGVRSVASTANGVVAVYRVTLDIVRLGAIELRSVEAMVVESGLDTALLGMSFLNRVEMKREGSTMTLTRRF